MRLCRMQARVKIDVVKVPDRMCEKEDEKLLEFYISFICQPEDCLLYRTYDSFYCGHFGSTTVLHTRDRRSDFGYHTF